MPGARDLRHTFASHYLAGGGDLFKLSRILGHSSVAVTERTSAHLRADAHPADDGRGCPVLTVTP